MCDGKQGNLCFFKGELYLFHQYTYSPVYPSSHNNNKKFDSILKSSYQFPGENNPKTRSLEIIYGVMHTIDISYN